LGVGNLIDSAGNPFIQTIPLSGIDSAGNAVTAAGNGVNVSGNATKEEEEEDINNSNNNSPPVNPDYRRSENQKRITRDFRPDEHDYLILKGQAYPETTNPDNSL
jgi:hypothetical protein